MTDSLKDPEPTDSSIWRRRLGVAFIAVGGIAFGCTVALLVWLVTGD